MEFIEIEAVGKMMQDKNYSDSYQSQPLPIQFFDGKKLEITIYGVHESDPNLVSEASRAIQSFLLKDEKEKYDYSSLVYQNYLEVVEMVGADFFEIEFEIENERDIWKYVYPSQIYVSRNSDGDEDVYLEIKCGCEWEDEHGLQLIFRRGLKLTRVSEIDGHLT